MATAELGLGFDERVNVLATLDDFIYGYFARGLERNLEHLLRERPRDQTLERLAWGLGEPAPGGPELTGSPILGRRFEEGIELILEGYEREFKRRGVIR
jgi:hypothetical protein